MLMGNGNTVVSACEAGNKTSANRAQDNGTACADVPQLHVSIECACSVAARACMTSGQETIGTSRA